MARRFIAATTVGAADRRIGEEIKFAMAETHAQENKTRKWRLPRRTRGARL
jgi:hypothetical protein